MTPRTLRIGAAVLIPGTGALIGPGGRVHLVPQAARVLACLAARPGRVVPARELIAVMYAGAPPADVDLDANMRTALKVMRAALRDTRSGAGVTTVHGLGRRLDVPALDGAVGAARIEPRPLTDRQVELLRAHEAGVGRRALAERFGYARGEAVSMALQRIRQRLPSGEPRP